MLPSQTPQGKENTSSPNSSNRGREIVPHWPGSDHVPSLRMMERSPPTPTSLHTQGKPVCATEGGTTDGEQVKTKDVLDGHSPSGSTVTTYDKHYDLSTQCPSPLSLLPGWWNLNFVCVAIRRFKVCIIIGLNQNYWAHSPFPDY